MKTHVLSKVTLWILPLITAILSWVMPISIGYGLLIGSLAAFTLFITHKTKEHWALRLLITLCMILFYAIALSVFTVNYITS